MSISKAEQRILAMRLIRCDDANDGYVLAATTNSESILPQTEATAKSIFIGAEARAGGHGF